MDHSANARSLRRLLGVLLLVLLAALAIARSQLGTARDGFTIDEPWHIVAGTSYVRGQGFHLNPEHPPLVKLWVGAAMPASFKLRPPQAVSEKEKERKFVQEIMYLDNDRQAAQQRARLALWALNGALLLVLGLLLWHALGLAWAVGTLAFLALEPTVAAHMPVVMTDLPLALTLAIAAVCAGLLAARWRWRWAAACGLAMGLALISKHSALAGVGGLALLLVLVAQWGWRQGWRGGLRRHLQLGAAAAIAFTVLWGAYGFRFQADPDGRERFNRPMQAKIDELRLPHWKQGIGFAHRHALLPRAYLWGLADTVRTGVEGRSQGMYFVWGKWYPAKPPWFAWPAIIASKLPLALLLLALASVPLVVRRRMPATTHWALCAVAAACAAHMAALVDSGGIWGGIRHALPVVVGLAIVSGALADWAWRRRSRTALALAAAPYVVAFAMTAREPHVWEYHNELVGGTSHAFLYFDNEGLDLRQRYGEILAYYRNYIAPSGLPLYSRLSYSDELRRADRWVYTRTVESLDDSNIEGKWTGWFVNSISGLLPVEQADWDPKRDLKGLVLVARFGNTGIWKGTLQNPKARAGAMGGRVAEYIYKEDGQDWPKVAARLEEVVKVLPIAIGAHFELGNAYVRMGQRERAVVAYQRMFEQKQMPIDPLVQKQVEDQIALLRSDAPMSAIQPLRSPWLE